MAEPIWIEKPALISLHSRSLADHGGADGLRDEGLLESALHRAIDRFRYGGVTDIVELAATYADGVARNHPFVDGNKRAALLCAALFLRLNGMRLTAGRVDATRTTIALAAGDLDLDAFAKWLRNHSRPA